MTPRAFTAGNAGKRLFSSSSIRGLPSRVPLTAVILLLAGLLSNPAFAQRSEFVVAHPDSSRALLLREEDTDGDRRITVLDPPFPGTGRGDKDFWLTSRDGKRWEFRGEYRCSLLLEELTRAVDSREPEFTLDRRILSEGPADHIARAIRERLWDGLTRRIDEAGLPAMLHDSKIHTIGDSTFLYVPFRDSLSWDYYSRIIRRHPEWRSRLIRLPSRIPRGFPGADFRRHGMLVLGLERDSTGVVRPRPFVVPGGRFNEMYGWDSYFIILGLLQDHRIDLARQIINNMVYEIRFYGKILNANRTYYLTRSQPPFLTSMVRAIIPYLKDDARSAEWVRNVIEAAITEYENVWTGPDRLTATGLSRYFDEGTGIPPEVEPGHYNEIFHAVAAEIGRDPSDVERDYREGRFQSARLDSFFLNDRAMRESGHDTSYRLLGRCADLVTVDLNSLLYRAEMDIADFIGRYAGGSLVRPNGSREIPARWRELAAKRKQLMFRYLRDTTSGLFFDYDVRRSQRLTFLGATTFYPLWAGMLDTADANRLIRSGLPCLEMAGGIAGSTEDSRGPISETRPQRQWDYPYGWAPHQMLVWAGLVRYGHIADAERCAYRWLYTIAANAASYNGTVPEKFDVVRRTHQVFAEYGNVGTTFSYITREGFGWTNASFVTGLPLLTTEHRRLLNSLVPPEGVNGW